LKKHGFFHGNIEPHLDLKKKKKPGLVRVRSGRPGSGSTHRVARFGRAIVTAGLLLNPDRSSHQAGRVPGQLARPGQVGFNNCDRIPRENVTAVVSGDKDDNVR